MKSLSATLVLCLISVASSAKEYSNEETLRLTMKMAKISAEVAAIRLEAILNGGSICGGDNDCCTSSNQCSVGEGDCDSSSDCASDLVCGNDNCGEIKEMALSQMPPGSPQRAEYEKFSFSGTDDCCWYDDEISEFVKASAKKAG